MSDSPPTGCDCLPAPQEAGPCDWPILECRDCPSLEDLIPDDGQSPPGDAEILREAILQSAVDHLWRWTGQQYGLCTVELRPCRRECPPSTYEGGHSSPFRPALIQGEWYNLSCGTCGSSCSCTELSEVSLPGPVHDVSCVLLDGVQVPPEKYRVDNWSRLVAQDGLQWPSCQDMSAECGPGTFIVHYRRGIPVPAAGQLAAGVLAIEIAKAVCGDKSCALSGRVETVTRQDVTMVLAPPDLGTGATGIWIVDEFIRTHTKTKRTARAINPDRWLRQRRPTSRSCVGC